MFLSAAHSHVEQHIKTFWTGRAVMDAIIERSAALGFKNLTQCIIT